MHCVVRGGWVGRSVRGSLFASCGKWAFFLFLQYGPPTGCLGVPPSPLLHSSVLQYRTYCCTAVLLPCVIIFLLQNLHTEDDTFTTVRTAALLLPCRYFILLVLNTEDAAPICFCPPYRPATGIFREYH